MWAVLRHLAVAVMLIAVYTQQVQGDLIIEPTDPPNGVEYPNVPNRGIGIAFFEHLSKNLPLTLSTIKSSTGAAVRLTGDGGLPIIMDANGVLTLQQEMNHETFCTDASSELSCYKIIDILEGVSPRLVYVYLKDSNDNLPQFVDPESCIGTIDENTDYPNICQFVAKDEDRWIDRDTLEFSLRDTSALFQIDNASGVLSLQSGQKADFETSTTHRLYIQVKDSSNTGPPYTQIITVKDLPDMPPTFDGLASSYNVLESTQPGGDVTTLKATDGDREIDDKIKFTFIVTDGQSSSGDDYFALDGDTGKITVNTNLDAVEIMNQRKSLVFSCQVIGTEETAPNAEVRALISIVVIDEDNSDPHFKDGDDNFEVDFLETQQGIIQSFTVVDDDVDPTLNSYNAELKPPAGGGDMSWFTEFVEVSPTNGAGETIFNVQVQAGKSLDFDTVPEWRNPVDFTVDIKSIDGTKTITAHIKLTVHGQNDNIPKWEFQDGATEYVVPVDENSVQDIVIATLKATDDDFEQEFGPSSLIYGWDPDSRRPDYLGIDPASGDVTIIKPTAFDFELLPAEVFVVKVWDNNNGPETKSISTFLRINVIDLNDEQPTIRATANRFEIQENSAPGLITQTIITASDADANSNLNFSLSAPQFYSKGQRLGISNIDWFTIENDADGETGNLMLVVIPDRETADRVEFDVVVEDLETDPNYSGKRTDSISMVITIGDENDVSPKFDDFDPDISILETDFNSLNQSESQRKIVELTATDADSKTNFYFRLTSNHENGAAMLDLVELDRTGPVTNGKVTLRRQNLKDVDRETFAFLDFDITVYDDDPEGGTNPRSDTRNLVVAVDDRNDNTPEWIMDYPSFNYHVVETSNSQFLKKQSVHAEGDILILPCDPPPAFNEDYCLQATDADDATQSYGQVKYVFDPDTTDSSILAAFDVNLETGCICTKETDREIRSSYDITFMAVDNYRPGGTTDSKNNKTVLHITVDDINDNFPIFAPPGGSEIFATIDESFLSDVAVHQDMILVTDADENDNAKMEVKIKTITCTRNPEPCPAGYEDSFRIDPDYSNNNEVKFQIFTKNTFDFAKAYGTYCIEIEAINSADAGNPMTVVATYCVRVEDINNEDPTFTQGMEFDGITFYVNESTRPGDELTDHFDQSTLFFAGVDLDEPGNPNSDAYCQVKSDDNALKYFQLDDTTNGRVLLKTRWNAADNIKTIPLCVNVRDKGTPPRESATQVCFSVTLKPIGTHPPKFMTRDFPFEIPENDETRLIGEFPAADDQDNIGVEDDPIYYHIAGYESAPVNNFYFQNNTINSLSVNETFDYEERKQYIVYVLTSNYPDGPPMQQNPPLNESYITLTIGVKDEIDVAPIFTRNPITAGISTKQTEGDIVLNTLIEVNDIEIENSGDNITYSLTEAIPSDGSLSGVTTPFSLSDVVDNTANLTMSFTPQTAMRGHFTFDIIATDSNSNSNRTVCMIYLVGDDNRVTFTFDNDKAVVESKKNIIRSILTGEFSSTCNIETVDQVKDAETGTGIPAQTNAVTHFIDSVANEPKPKSEIELMMSNDPNLYTRLFSAFAREGLDMQQPGAGNNGEGDGSDGSNSTIVYVLIGGCALLAAILVIVSVTFFFRNNSTVRKLRALNANANIPAEGADFRNENVPLPNTNIHANKGSNPVWNEDDNGRKMNFDAESMQSDASVLSGVEVQDFKNEMDESDGNSIYQNDDDYGEGSFGENDQEYDNRFDSIRNPAYNLEDDAPPNYYDYPKTADNGNEISLNPYASVSRRNPLMTMGLDEA